MGAADEHEQQNKVKEGKLYYLTELCNSATSYVNFSDNITGMTYFITPGVVTYTYIYLLK